jgi:hypothetical protein
MEELRDHMQSRPCKIVYGHHLLGERAFPAINGANVFCFLSSLPLLPPATTAVFGSSCHLSNLNYLCVAGKNINPLAGEKMTDKKAAVNIKIQSAPSIDLATTIHVREFTLRSSFSGVQTFKNEEILFDIYYNFKHRYIHNTVQS